MADSDLQRSPLWQQLQNLKPQLASHAELAPRDYRGELYYVLHDKAAARFHRLTASAYELLGAMNGERTLPQILQVARQGLNHSGADDLPDAEDLLELLQYLQVADLLICDMPPSTQALFARRQQSRRAGWRRLWANPLTWRIRLGNPNALLDRLQPLALALAKPWVGVLWLVVVGLALALAVVHWPRVAGVSFGDLLSPTNLLLLWLTYPVMKILHELSHGLFTKAFGGNVYECGVVFVVGVPLPYVDATAATGFASKAQRLMVGAAGMALEMLLAALAFMLWLAVENAFLQALLLNIVILGSVSTLLFNGNPLLKFDGYHLLCDWLETPNLASRARAQLRYLLERYGYGLTACQGEARTAAGACWLTAYGLAATAYRFVIFGFIFMLLARVSLPLALLLAVWVLSLQLFWPLARYFYQLLSHTENSSERRRIGAVTALFIIAVGLFTAVVPVPLSTRVDGVIWLPEDSRLRAGAAGQVAHIAVSDGQTVAAGQRLLELHNPQLRSQLAVKRAQVQEYQLRAEQFFSSDRPRAALLREDLAVLRAELVDLQQQVEQLQVVSSADGTVYWANPDILPGRYLERGDLLAYVDSSGLSSRRGLRVRTALTQEQAGLVQKAAVNIDVRLSGNTDSVLPGKRLSQLPAVGYQLPSAALGAAGGGRLAVKSDDASGLQTQQQVFLLDIQIPKPDGQVHYGQRAYVKFIHPPEPLIKRWYRQLHQLFIRQLYK